MLGDQPSAEDVGQEAFFGLHRRLGTLRNTDRALAYVRSSVFNGCRSVLLSGEHRAVLLAALGRIMKENS